MRCGPTGSEEGKSLSPSGWRPIVTRRSVARTGVHAGISCLTDSGVHSDARAPGALARVRAVASGRCWRKRPSPAHRTVLCGPRCRDREPISLSQAHRGFPREDGPRPLVAPRHSEELPVVQASVLPGTLSHQAPGTRKPPCNSDPDTPDPRRASEGGESEGEEPGVTRTYLCGLGSPWWTPCARSARLESFFGTAATLALARSRDARRAMIGS
jgi:hypothetical protein